MGLGRGLLGALRRAPGGRPNLRRWRYTFGFETGKCGEFRYHVNADLMATVPPCAEPQVCAAGDCPGVAMNAQRSNLADTAIQLGAFRLTLLTSRLLGNSPIARS